MSYLIIFILYLIIWLFSDIFWLSALGLSLVIIEFILLYKNLGYSVQYHKYALVIALLQWFVAPLLDYYLYNTHYLYHMYVPEEEYMALAVPSLFCFKIGMDIVSNRIQIIFEDIITSLSQLDVKDMTSIGKVLIGLGMLSTILYKISLPSLAFVFYLLSNLKYVGGIVLLYYNRQVGSIVLLILFLLLFYESISFGMFHELLLWSILLIPFCILSFSPKSYFKPLALILFFILTFVVQTVKEDFRAVVWYSPEVNNSSFQVFSDVLKKNNSNDEFSSESNLHKMVIRINQGWIISKIIQHVPRTESFAEGETLLNAFTASFVPRLLSPNKSGAGGRELFIRFTGLNLSKSASMGISILGESYANFGFIGSYFFLMLWGLLLGCILYFHLRFSEKYPLLLFFLPWIFIDPIKAETDLITAMNYITKAYILLIIIFFSIKKFGLHVNK